MKKTKKILFPTDFSEPSANAFRYALLLADHLNATLDVLHVGFPVAESIGAYTGYVDSSSLMLVEGLKAKTNTFIETGITQILEQLQNTPVVNSDVMLGTPINSISHIAMRDQFDFILIGSRGENKSMIDKMMGSVAAGVVENAPCPVIVIPEQAIFKTEITLAYATSLLDVDPFEIWKSFKLLEPLSPSIRVIHIRMPDEELEKMETKIEQMEAFFKEHHPELNIKFHMIPGRNLQKELDTFIDVYKPGMMVMYRPHHSFWNSLFFKSNTKEMAVHTKLPLLVQKEG